MPEAADGHASAADFDFYEDSDSLFPIGTGPAPILPHPHPRLQELRGQNMPGKSPPKKPTPDVIGVRQSSRVKRKPSVQASRPSKKSKKARRVVESSDEDEGDGDDNGVPVDVGSEEDEDKNPSDHLEALNAMSAMDVSKRNPRVRTKDKRRADVDLLFKSRFDKDGLLSGYSCNICR
jgi:hypothetical protein